MTFQEFKSQLAMLLCDQPRGTTADLAGFAVAYWDGRDVAGVYLRNNGRLDEEYDLDVSAFERWHDAFVAWLVNPRCTVRADLVV
jgi:hypothetical protein